jgi:hypothetical protein
MGDLDRTPGYGRSQRWLTWDSFMSDERSEERSGSRPRNAAQTRADIRRARRRFATEGYERSMLRAVAADVGVDAAPPLRTTLFSGSG